MSGLDKVIRRFAGNPPQPWGTVRGASFPELPGDDAPAEFYEAFDKINAEVFNNELERVHIRVNTPEFNSGFVSWHGAAARGRGAPEFIGFWETFPDNPEYMYEQMARSMAYVTRRPKPLPSAAPASPPQSPPEDPWIWPLDEDEPVRPPVAPIAPPTSLPLVRWASELPRYAPPPVAAPARPDVEGVLLAVIKLLADSQAAAPRQYARAEPPIIDVTPTPVRAVNRPAGLLPPPSGERIFDFLDVRAKTPAGRK